LAEQLKTEIYRNKKSRVNVQLLWVKYCFIAPEEILRKKLKIVDEI
jgi:hypothetical protein